MQLYNNGTELAETGSTSNTDVNALFGLTSIPMADVSQVPSRLQLGMLLWVN